MLFTINELLMIKEDQEDALKNVHQGDPNKCNIAECPPDHFGDEDIEEIFIRQDILKKI